MTDRSKDDYEKPWGTGGVKREREKKNRKRRREEEEKEEKKTGKIMK